MVFYVIEAPDQQILVDEMNSVDGQERALERKKAILKAHQEFFVEHPNQSQHVVGASPVVGVPNPTKAPDVRRVSVSERHGMLKLSVYGDSSSTGAGLAPKGDLSHSYPVSFIYDFPTRFKLSQKSDELDMTAYDEYGNPVLCFHGENWFLKRKMSIVDLRTGKKCGKMIEELKAATGHYKFNIWLDEKDEKGAEKKHGSVSRLGDSQVKYSGTTEIVIRTPSGESKVVDSHLGTELVFSLNEAPQVGWSYSAIDKPLVDGDNYFVHVAPGTDIRMMLAIVACFDKLTTPG